MSTNKKITELAELAEADLSDDDVLPIVDISNNSTKKIRKSTLTSALAGVSTITATSPLAVNQNTGAVTISTGTIPINKGGTGQTTASAALAALGGFSDPTTTRGDILTRGASALGRLGLGTANYVLKSSGTDPEWGQVSATELTGVLATANGGTGLSAIGTAGQVLTVNSGASGLEWAAGVVSGTVTLDRFSGTGSQTAFTLSQAPDNENLTQVYISGVYQQKNTYSLSGTTLTFTTAPPSGSNNIEIMNTGASFFGVSPSIGTVTTGAAGSSASVSITSGGVMSFTIPRGDTGAAGAAGAAATIAVGSTTTGNAGTSASVSNSGSSSAATFNFTIPRGDTGATGATGAAGAAATIAAGSATGLAAGASPTVTNTGSSSAATFNFGIPAGATGAAGSAATIAVGTVSTGAPGSSATVTNVGSSSAATFNFSIPQGTAGTGSGDVTGPGSSTDNAITRFDATTGKLLQNSTITLSDTGTFSTGTNANLELDPNGSGKVVFKGNATKGSGQFILNCENNSHGIVIKGPPHSAAASYTLTLPNDDGSANQVLKTDGSGTLAWVDPGASSGANSDITSLTGLTTDLTVAQGGTGAGTFTANGVLVGNGTSAVTATAVGTSGHVLTSNGSGNAPTFQAAGGGGASDIDGLSDGRTFNSGKAIGLGTGAAASLSNNPLMTAVGYNAGNDHTYEHYCTYFGYEAGSKATGGYNTYIGALNGDQSSAGTVTGTFNSIVGYANFRNPTTGSRNSFVGTAIAESATTAGFNSSVGTASLNALTTGTYNVAFGASAGDNITTGSNNTIIGNGADASSATVSNEITMGNTSVDKFRIPGINFTIKDSTATDNYVLTVDSNGEAGWEAAAGGGGASDINGLSDAITNSSGETIGLGTGALAADDGSSNDNTALGYQAGNDITTGRDNVLMGYQAGDKLTTGLNNVAIGYQAMHTNGTTHDSVIAIGSKAMENAGPTSSVVAIGTNAARNNTPAANQVLIGYNCGTYAPTTDGYGTFVGTECMYGVNGTPMTGFGNSGYGYGAMRLSKNSCNGNTAIGYGSMSALDAGNWNTALGYLAGDSITSGSNLTTIGYQADATSATATNEITLGNSSISTLRCQVQTISSLSDRRDKKDIEELPLGIDFINTLKPVKFTWNMRDGAKVGQQEAGFIAQDLNEAQIAADAEDYLSLVLKNNPEKLEASYGKLVPVLVKAVQELSAEVATLKKEIENG